MALKGNRGSLFNPQLSYYFSPVITSELLSSFRSNPETVPAFHCCHTAYQGHPTIRPARTLKP